ncbi:MAG: hypothetical protein H6567_09755, partial [Lewinellaceae bacterium]|nr:hypothetical protein [Lewinellaceae bacterium]
FAQVNYTVSRISRIPWYFEWSYIKPQEARLDVGQVTTDEKGEFEISFELVGDDQFSPESNPSFTFQTNVTITDSRGETREGKQFVRAAYKSHYLSIKTDQNQDMSDLDTIQFDAFNFADISINASALLKIEKLNEPKNVDWSDFDTSMDMPKRQKRRIIYQQPREIYENWPVEKVLLETKIDLPLSWFGMQKFTSGVYKITLMDATDNENKVEKFVVITNAPKNQFPITRPIHLVLNKRAYKPGESLHITLGNATNKSQFIQLVILKDNEILYESNVVVDKKREITFPIMEKYRGDIFIKLNYVLNNRYFSEEERVEIPWNNKMLDIEYITFRDKCLPGAKESYQLKIKGKNKDAVFAEVLASIYDASLDQFKPNIWNHEFYPKSNNNVSFFALNFMKVISQTEYQSWGETVPSIYIHYPTLIPLYLNSNNMMFYSRSNMEYDGMAVPRTMQAERKPAKALMGKANDIVEEAPPTVEENQSDAPPLVRKNLKETVFFYPDLTTDKDGNLTISFTMNDALTQWKMMILSHTVDFKVGYDEKFIQTQKNVMVFPNSPRFLRDGDQISFKSKVTNLTNQTLTGNMKLQFFDALTGKDIASEIISSQHDIPAHLLPKGSATVSWHVHIPELKYSVITYRVTADFGEHIDIEENTIPILTNKMLVTETMPFWLNGNEIKKFEFQAFKQNTSTTKTDFKYTVELTSHPIWYAIQAMPYMQLQNNNNIIGWSDQFYTNTLASYIVHKHPRIKSVFDSWQTLGKNALLSNLSKNEELKSAILQETPWVQDALNEEEQKRNIALLFDLNLLAQNRQSIISKIKNAQLSNGGFPWFAGGRDDLYTTMYIAENWIHLIQLGIIEKDDRVISEILSKATNYLDIEILNRYNRMAENVKKYGGKLEDDHLDEMATLYIYLRSMLQQPFANEASQKVYEYYITQAAQYWNKRGIFSQANIGLALNRAKNQTWKKIKASLDERAMNNAELGQYWNEGNGFRWYQLPIERHARLIEFYIAAGAEPSIVNKMKLWLLKNKQTNAWKTSKATAAALFALLINGEADGITSLINEVKIPSISVGGKLITKNANEVEAGTGYFKESFSSAHIDKSLSNIQVSNPNHSVVWGAAYYQYFETLDHIRQFDDTPLKISKKYFKLENGEKNDVLHEVTSSQPLKIGDRVIVRMTMICDRDMEYVQLKDMRPSGFEPTNVLSGYKYQAGLSYYEATTDLATNFYFNVLPKGTYVFEYKVVVNHSGEYTGGITSAQCMYAPEFSSHSQGETIKISE